MQFNFVGSCGSLDDAVGLRWTGSYLRRLATELTASTASKQLDQPNGCKWSMVILKAEAEGYGPDNVALGRQAISMSFLLMLVAGLLSENIPLL